MLIESGAGERIRWRREFEIWLWLLGNAGEMLRHPWSKILLLFTSESNSEPAEDPALAKYPDSIPN